MRSRNSRAVRLEALAAPRRGGTGRAPDVVAGCFHVERVGRARRSATPSATSRVERDRPPLRTFDHGVERSDRRRGRRPMARSTAADSARGHQQTLRHRSPRAGRRPRSRSTPIVGFRARGEHELPPVGQAVHEDVEHRSWRVAPQEVHVVEHQGAGDRGVARADRANAGSTTLDQSSSRRDDPAPGRRGHRFDRLRVRRARRRAARRRRRDGGAARTRTTGRARPLAPLVEQGGLAVARPTDDQDDG